MMETEAFCLNLPDLKTFGLLLFGFRQTHIAAFSNPFSKPYETD